MNEIMYMSDLQQLVVSGGDVDWSQYGDITTQRLDNLILFNYTQACQYTGRWNWLERNSRGLILDTNTGAVIARPFAKFFNYGERMPPEDAQILEITEKMDGSLGILYHHNNEWRIATRGSFTSEQAIWATDYFQKHYDWAEWGINNLTLLFEIIYPTNRIVVNYGDFQGLVLIGAIDRITGHDLTRYSLEALAERLHFPLPKIYTFNSLSEIAEAAKALSVNEEGWVIRMSDGERYKVKGDAYKLAHRIMTGVTFNRVLDAVVSGQYDAMIEGVPDEFLDHVKAFRSEIESTVTYHITTCDAHMQNAPTGNRKDFALWVQANVAKSLHGYMFALLDGKDITPLIYRNAFKNRSNADVARLQEGGAE